MAVRRNLLKAAVAIGFTGMIGKGATMAFAADDTWHMPDEGDPHTATWMAFGPSEDVWGKKLQRGAQTNLAAIAKAISAHEPVNMLVRAEDRDTAERLCGDAVTLFVHEIDDLWMRDTGPVFVKNGAGQLAGVDFNFNGWGNKQDHSGDAEVAEFVTGKTKVETLRTKLVLEGGGIEVDGKGTAIITESCVLNKNRNPGVSREQCEEELGRLLGLKKIIWLPGIKGKDITDGHTDFYARFVSPGVVVAGLDTDPTSYDHAVTKRHLELLKEATDSAGQKLQVVVIPGPGSVRPQFENKEFAAGYINFYLCNGAVITPEFGDKKADNFCRDALRDVLPGREIVQLNIDAIAAGGGGIHCTTQQQPA